MSATDILQTLVERAAHYFNDARPLVPMYLHLILSALFPIYAGAHASLSRPSSAAKPTKKVDEEDDEKEDKVQKMEGLSNKDAIVLPITAGITLGTLYFLIMKYGADLINLIMSYYFAGVGIFSVAQFVNDATSILTGFVFPTYFRSKRSVAKVAGAERKVVHQSLTSTSAETSESNVPTPLLSSRSPLWLVNRVWDIRQSLKQTYTVKAFIGLLLDLTITEINIINVFSALAGLATVVYVNTVAKPWYLTNLQGFAVSYSALQLLSPTTFATGSLILGALFFYDIWAVFFTPLMVAVAKNLDQPIKLVFPRPDEPSATPGEPPTKMYSMLGLGDIVVPGIMIGMALRFDLYMFYLKKQKRTQQKTTDSSTDDSAKQVQKAPYVPVTGRWGDRFWTLGVPSSSLPPQLKTSFPRPYFTASIIGYVVGMLTTLGVMSIFRHAQPALLYLVPGVLICLWSTALVRGELREMWTFSEAVNAEQVEEVHLEGNESDKPVVEKSPKGLFERVWDELWHGGKKAPEPESPSKADTASKSTESKKDESGADDGSREEDGKDELIFSFSVSRDKPKGIKTTKPQALARSANNDGKASPTISEGFDDTVVVSSADLDGTQDSDASPRYRTRSVRATSSSKQ